MMPPCSMFTSNAGKYNTSYSRALNLGIYGTDLGYTNIYEQGQDGLDYMASIKDLADGLNIGQFFDLEVIGKLATNSNSLDSLLQITTQNFNNINAYLQEQERAHLSILLLTGGWLEAMHITCQVSSKDTDNAELQEKIGEQKIILESVILLLGFYSNIYPTIAALLEDMNRLYAAFENIKITITEGEQVVKVVNGVLVIEGGNESHVEITSENVEEIKNITSDIRAKIIS